MIRYTRTFPTNLGIFMARRPHFDQIFFRLVICLNICILQVQVFRCQHLKCLFMIRKNEWQFHMFLILSRAVWTLFRKMVISSLNSTFSITETLDFIISFELHLVYQAACYITGVLSCIYTFFYEEPF